MTSTRHDVSPSNDPEPAFVDELFERWLPGAMFPSETLWLVRMIREAGIEIVIECGRQDGVSTWVLATMLRDTGARILSIDFDDDPDRVARVRTALADLPVTCVSGDIHAEVPRLLREHRSRSIAVIQDGPKGWEGMATLLASADEPGVALLAQHNLHRDHVTRTVFQMLSLRPAFLEDAAAGDPLLTEVRQREITELPGRAPNRAIDHTSLGLMLLDDPARAHLLRAIEVARHRMAPWDPVKVAQHWHDGDFGYCTRLRARVRFSPARFKRR